MQDILVYFAYICLVFALVSGMVFWQYLDSVFKVLLLQVSCAFVAETAGIVYMHLNRNNTFIFNSYILIELGLLGYIGISLLKNAIYKKIALAFLMGCAIMDILCVWKMGLNTFANWGYLCECVLFSVVFLAGFVKLYSSNPVSELVRHSYFWMCLGIAIYFGGSVPLFGIINYAIRHNGPLANKLFGINEVLIIIRCSFIATAFILRGKQTSTPKAA